MFDQPFSARWFVTIGQHKTPGNYREVLLRKKNKIGKWADEILDHVPCAQSDKVISLVSVYVHQLGFPHGGTLQNIYKAILSRGGYLCDAEIGPAFRLLLEKLSKDERYYIAMHPILDSCNTERIFRVNNTGKDRWLSVGKGRAATYLLPHCQIVFGLKTDVDC